MPERGFTLLEIMRLVIFLIGLASAGVVQTFCDRFRAACEKKRRRIFLTRYAQFKDRAVIEGENTRCANRPTRLPVYAASSRTVVARFLDSGLSAQVTVPKQVQMLLQTRK